ncbi:DsrH/TusB family sulfur relay protein [Alteromonas lipotrueae]|uniref:DsrH/TusB family sulfur relay protein n=1 Tax=Alteromonas lipotrueae TaxID=2803814 RepID=UPI001C44DECC|nr:DsrH/TusB family sulfur relay protein [Alteromonas lipotrueae]
MLFIVKSYPLNAVAIKTLQQALKSADSANALVLIDDGVYYAQHSDDGLFCGFANLVSASLGLANTINAREDLRRETTSMFALQEDMALRGVSRWVNEGDNKVSVTPISSDELVTLTDTFYPVVYL